MKRRHVLSLAGSVGLAWAGLASANAAVSVPSRSAPQRVIVIGGGWAGLSAARALRLDAPELDVLLIDREPVFRSLPLSNPWLVDRTPERLPRLNLAPLAQSLGYRFIAADVQAIDRAQRQVQTAPTASPAQPSCSDGRRRLAITKR